MCRLAFLLGSALFFTPFIYVPLYLYIERNFSHHALVQNMLKIFTVLGGLFMIIYACTTPLDFMVLMPSRGGAKIMCRSLLPGDRGCRNHDTTALQQVHQVLKQKRLAYLPQL